MAEAQALNLPDARPQRDLLRALLCCRDVTLKEIAVTCAVDPDVLGLFSDLLWLDFPQTWKRKWSMPTRA